MDSSALRRMDRTVGLVASALLTLMSRLGGPAVGSSPAHPSRMVIIKLAEQGATVLAYGALRRAAATVGQANVFVVVFAPNRDVLDELGVVPAENVLTIRTHHPGIVAWDVVRVVRRLRRERVDTAIDMEFFSRSSAVLAFLSGAAVRVGLHSFHGEGAWRGDLFTHRVSHNPRLHASEWFRALVESASAPGDRLPAMPALHDAAVDPPLIAPTVAEVAAVAAIVRRALPPGTVGPDGALPPLVLLNPNAGDLLPLRRWPDQRYGDLARRLLDADPELVVLLTGAPDEAAAVATVASSVDSPRCVSVAGRTTFRQLLVLHDLAEVLVTNDSGPAHYAAMSRVDVVALFGPESPEIFGSPSERAHHVWAALPCSPCVNAFNDRRSACTDNLCMQSIAVEDVADRVVEIRSQRPSRA